MLPLSRRFCHCTALFDYFEITCFQLPRGHVARVRSHDQYQVDRRSQPILMTPEDLPHLTPKTIAQHRMAHLSRRYHPEAGTQNFRLLSGPNVHLKDKDATIDSTSLLSNRLEITIPSQMLVRIETHSYPLFGFERYQTTVRRFRPFFRRLAMTWRPPRVDIRARNPILRARFFLCGRNVGCMEKRENMPVHSAVCQRQNAPGKLGG